MIATMSVRRDPIRDAAQKAHAAVARMLADAEQRRLAGGLPLAQVSEAVGCSRQRLAALERGECKDVGTIESAKWVPRLTT